MWPIVALQILNQQMSGSDAEARGTGTSQNRDQGVGGVDANLNSALYDPNVSLRSYVLCIIFTH